MTAPAPGRGGDTESPPPPGNGQPLLELRQVDKNFGPVQALVGINLTVPRGQVTALVGDNGAGKTAMIKTISGIWPPDGGSILWEGHRVQMHNPKDAAALGITTVYQDLALCDNLDIVQNMFLGHEVVHLEVLDEISMELAARSTLDSLAVTTIRSIRQPVASLSGGQRQIVAVARAVMSAIYNGMGLLNISTPVQLMVTAIVLLAALTVDRVARRGRAFRSSDA